MRASQNPRNRVALAAPGRNRPYANEYANQVGLDGAASLTAARAAAEVAPLGRSIRATV